MKFEQRFMLFGFCIEVFQIVLNYGIAYFYPGYPAFSVILMITFLLLFLFGNKSVVRFIIKYIGEDKKRNSR
jgi:hypothetical protein